MEVEKISELVVQFKLKNPYAAFLENLTLKILPKHIWQDISAQNFPLTNRNLAPVGSGPYKFVKLEQDISGFINSVYFKINSEYYGQKPFLSEIVFKFFEKEEDLIKSIKNNEVDSFSFSSFKNYNLLNSVYDPDTNSKENVVFNDYHFFIPRYFAVFFNFDESEVLAEEKVREALNYGTNKKEIVAKIWGSEAKIVDSPILPDIYGFENPKINYQFDLEKAISLLEETGFKTTETGIREKNIKKEVEFEFKKDLSVGSKNTEVIELQKCLAKDPEVYPEGQITGYFGSKTKEAVIKFQEKYKEEILEPSGLKKGTGLVGKSTRAKLNELCVKYPEETLPLSITLVTVDQP